MNHTWEAGRFTVKACIKIKGQSLNSELYPPFVRRFITDRLIFDATQYLFAPVNNSDR